MKTLLVLFISVVIAGCTSASHVVKMQPKPIKPIMVNGQVYGPLNTVRLRYPPWALSNKMSGFCTVEFTVAKDGTTKDHEIVECSNGVFKKASLNAAKLFKYSPLRLDGALVEVTGVKFTMKFESNFQHYQQELTPKLTAYISQFCSKEAKKTATKDQLKQCRLARQFLVLR
jgi:TonB family protein